MGAWFYNSVNGALNRVPTAVEWTYELPLVRHEWHKLHIPYTDTRAQALADAAKEYPGGAKPGGPVVQNLIGDATSGITKGASWARVAEVVLGLALLIVGLAKLAGNTQVGRVATSIGTKAALL